MPLKITNLEKDLPKLNAELQRLDALANTVAKLQAQATTSSINLLAKDHLQHQGAATNVTFTWTGGTLTLSWNAAWVKDRDGTTYSIPAGSQVLVASTYYWAAFNHESRLVGFYTTLDKLYAVIHNIALCQVFTGTGAQTGTAGGGGSAGGGTDITGAKFKLF